MDAFTTGFLASLVANGLTTFVSYLGREGTHQTEKKRNIAEILARDKPLSALLQGASTDLARRLNAVPPTAIDRLKLFLTSPDVDAIIRQIYAMRFAHSDKSMADIRNEFSASLALYIGDLVRDVEASANALFDSLLDSCDRALTVAVDRGLLSAHEAKSAARSRLILDELAAIKARVDLLNKREQFDIIAVQTFEQQLRTQIAARHAHIVPPHFDARRRIPIDDLYVTPVFSLVQRKQGTTARQQDYGLSRVLAFLYRAVILGNPGSGKSTLANKICHDFAANYDSLRLGGRRVTPIIIPLREYTRERKDKGASIVQLIETLCSSTSQVPPPARAIDYLLRSGRIFLIFDGLDELLDTSYRQKVTGDVESFANLYPGTPVLVTSRAVGYEQAPLDDRQFDTLRIDPFTDAQVDEYVKKWFAADLELTEVQRTEKADAFIRESQSVPDLRTNPLMLALMCNIYRGENYIPRNRPDVYEKCTVMLFEKWDKSRGIQVPLPFEAHVRPAMMYLAHWVFSQDTLQGGVIESALINKCTEYLCPRRYEDTEDARRAASEFIEFCRGRAWVFTDTGTTKTGERLYQFTHRTFLEYFTAAHLVRTHATPKELGDALVPHIAAREWDVVAQLAFQLQNKHIEGAGDALLKRVLQAAETSEKNGRRTSLLSFASRALEFLVPSPSVTRNIVNASFDHFFEVVISATSEETARRKDADLRGEDFVAEVVGALLACAEENRSPVSKQIQDYLHRGLAAPAEPSAKVSALTAINLSKFLFRPRSMRYQEFDPQLRDYWTTIGTAVVNANLERVRDLCKADLSTCLNAVFTALVSVREMAQWHGVESIFSGGGVPVPGLMYNLPIVPYVVLRLIEMHGERDKRSREAFASWLPRIDDASAFLTEVAPPWVPGGYAEELKRWYERPFGFHGPDSGIPPGIAPNLAFLAFVALALSAEISPPTAESVSNQERKVADHYFPAFQRATEVRYSETPIDALDEVLSHIGFSEEQIRLVRNWATGSVSFIRRRGTGSPDVGHHNQK